MEVLARVEQHAHVAWPTTTLTRRGTCVSAVGVEPRTLGAAPRRRPLATGAFNVRLIQKLTGSPVSSQIETGGRTELSFRQ